MMIKGGVYGRLTSSDGMGHAQGQDGAETVNFLDDHVDEGELVKVKPCRASLVAHDLVNLCLSSVCCSGLDTQGRPK